MDILGVGVVSPLGNGAQAFWEGLGGAHAPKCAKRSVATAAGEKELTVFESDDSGLERFAPRASLRRMDPFGKWALLATGLALEDAGLVVDDSNRTRIAVVFGSGYGCQNATYAFLDAVIDFGDKCASPTHFSNSVHNALASQASISLGIQGPCQTLTAFERTPMNVLWCARDLLARNVVDYVVAGFGDESCALLEYAIANVASAQASAADRPLPWNSGSFLVGTGFTCLLLGREGERPGAYATLGCLKQFEQPPVQAFAKHRAVYLSVHGPRGEGSSHALLSEHPNVVEARPLLGTMPTIQGFDLAAAALSLKHGELRPAPRDGNSVLAPGDSLVCMQADTDQGFHVACLGKA